MPCLMLDAEFAGNRSWDLSATSGNLWPLGSVLMAKRDQWIYAGGAVRRHPTGCQRSGEQQYTNLRERDRIGWTGFKQQAGNQTLQHQRNADADRQPGERERRATAQHHEIGRASCRERV